MTTRTVLKWWVQLNKTNQVKTAENVKKWKNNFWSYSFSLILFHFVFQNRKKEGRKEKRTHKSKGSIGRGRRWITSFLKCFYFLIYVLHFWLFCFIVHRHLGFDGDANSLTPMNPMLPVTFIIRAHMVITVMCIISVPEHSQLLLPSDKADICFVLHFMR